MGPLYIKSYGNAIMYRSDEGNQNRDIWSGISMISTRPGVDSPLMTWASHAVNNWILLLPLEGEGKIVVGNNELKSGKFDIALVAPNTPHRYHSSHYWKLLWIHFLLSPELLDNMLWPETVPRVRQMTLSPRMYAVTRNALTEAHSLNTVRGRCWHPLAMHLIEAAILRLDAQVAEDGTHIPLWVSRVMALLSGNTRNLGMDEIARRSGLSRAVFYEKFRQVTGYTPGEYRELQRLRQAEQMLLQTKLTVAQIADQCGYDSQFYFSLRFRKHYGMSPTRYRDALPH